MDMQDNDVAAHPSTPPTHTVIDLSSPSELMGPPLPMPGVLLPARSANRDSHKSDDELRLIANYDSPADAISAPDPREWNPQGKRAVLSTPTSLKRAKPGANSAFKVVDSMAESPVPLIKSRPKTYAKSDHRKQSIGRQQYTGQTEFLNSSASKRRKIMVPFGSDDDEVQQTSQLNSPQKISYAANNTSRSSGLRASSEISVESGRSRATSNTFTGHPSEFLTIQETVSKGISSRRQGVGRPSSHASNTVPSPAPTNIHRSIPPATESPDDSADELASCNPPQPASKATQATKKGAKGKESVNSTKQSFQLYFARSHNFKQKGPNLQLKLETDKTYSISNRDDEHNLCRIGNIDLSRVWRADTDYASCIRLNHSRHFGGNILMIDLEFLDEGECKDFLKAVKDQAKMVVEKKTWEMRVMFNKEFDRNEKVGKSSVIDDTGRAEAKEGLPKANKLKSPLLRAEERDSREAVQQPKRTLTRSLRSTKTSGPLFDVNQTESRVVGKYSIDIGLGPPWKRPLEYGQGRQRATVHFEDLARLDEEEYLNDSLIDLYMIHLFRHHHVPSDKVYVFNTYFFTALTKNSGRQSINYANVARWTAKDDVFGYDYIVVPINEATHWYLAIICNVSSIARKPAIEDPDDRYDPATASTHASTFTELTTQGVFKVESEPDPLPSSEPDPSYGHSLLHGLRKQGEEDVNLFEECAQHESVEPTHLDTTAKRKKLGKNTSFYDANYATAEGLGSLDNGALAASSKHKKAAKKRLLSPKKHLDQPVVLILDSLGQTRSRAARALKDWLSAEGKEKRGMEITITGNGYYPKSSQIPTQDNWSDCGVYLLGYVDKFFQNPDLFKNKLLAGEMSVKTDWPESELKEMRTSIRNVICGLAIEKKITRVGENQAKVRTATKKPASMEKNKTLELELPNSKPLNDRPPRVMSPKYEVPTFAQAQPTKALKSSGDISLKRLSTPFASPKRSTTPSGSWSPRDKPHSNDTVAPPPSASPATSPRSSWEHRGLDDRVARSPEKRHNARLPTAKALSLKNEAQQNREPPSLLAKEQQRNTECRLPALAASMRKPTPVRSSNRVSQVAQNPREGNAASDPIEILDSQQELSQQAKSPKKSPAKLPLTNPFRGDSSTSHAHNKLLATSSMYFHDATQAHERRERSRGTSPMLMDMGNEGSWQGSEVEETPEPDDGRAGSMEL